MANFIDITARDTFSSSTSQDHALGAIGRTPDGRIFRYAVAGVSDTVAGSLYQSAAPIAAHLANTPPAVAINAKSFTYTPGATAGAANLYAEGYMQVDTAPGAGYTYVVSGHAAIASSTAFTLTLRDPIQVALTTSSRVGLVHNAFKNAIVAPTTLTAGLAGVAPCIITAAQYGWLQTRGPASVLINGTPGVGVSVTNSATTAGAVDVITTTNLVTSDVVGRMMQVGVSTKLNFVFLTID